MAIPIGRSPALRGADAQFRPEYLNQKSGDPATSFVIQEHLAVIDTREQVGEFKEW
jgi:hypothetical protein